MRHVDAKDTLKMAAADDQDMIEAVSADRAHPPLGMGIRIRRPQRRPNDSAACGAEDLVEPTANFESRSWIRSRNG
jgi:hypothetical protein